jgi:hypothetical protein
MVVDYFVKMTCIVADFHPILNSPLRMSQMAAYRLLSARYPRWAEYQFKIQQG